VTILLAILAFNLPLYVFHKVVISAHPVTLNFSGYKKMYGTLYEGLRIKERLSLAIIVVFLFQRLLFVTACVVMVNRPYGQTASFIGL